MTAHTSPDELTRYITRALPPADVLALLTHVETCRECREALAEARLDSLASTAAPLLCPPGEVHLAEDEMVAFVAGRMPEPERAAAAKHVAACEICRDSVAAMESERNLVRGVPMGSPKRRIRWFALAGAVAAGFIVAAGIHFRLGKPVSSSPAPIASVRDSGGTIELEANGSLRGLDAISPQERDLVRDALKLRSLPAGPRLSREAPGVLLSPDAGSGARQFSLSGPVNTRVLPDRPVFTWQPSPGASAYQVVVTNEKLDPLARSGRIKDQQWQPEMPLPRGILLLWQVRAWHGDEMVSAPAPPAPPARFEIASEQIAARLREIRQGPKPSHLLAAVLCAREGLGAEAEMELQALARENPDSALIGSLLASLGRQ